MKKKVILLIGDQFQRNASLFIKNYTQLNGHIDAVLCIQPKRNIISTSKKILKRLSIQFLKQKLISFISKITGMPTLQSIKNAWVTTGENSWDLLQKGLDIFEFTKKNNINLFFTTSLNAPLIKSIVKEDEAIIIFYAGGILNDALLSIPKVSFVNAHMGEMPRYRGMNVIEWAYLENNAPKVSVMLLNEKIDGGDIIYEMFINVSGISSIAELRKVGYEACAVAMAKGIFHYAHNQVIPQPQEKGARYYYKMHKEVRSMVEKKISTKLSSV